MLELFIRLGVWIRARVWVGLKIRVKFRVTVRVRCKGAKVRISVSVKSGFRLSSWLGFGSRLA